MKLGQAKDGVIKTEAALLALIDRNAIALKPYVKAFPPESYINALDQIGDSDKLRSPSRSDLSNIELTPTKEVNRYRYDVDLLIGQSISDLTVTFYITIDRVETIVELYDVGVL